MLILIHLYTLKKCLLWHSYTSSHIFFNLGLWRLVPVMNKFSEMTRYFTLNSNIFTYQIDFILIQIMPNHSNKNDNKQNTNQWGNPTHSIVTAVMFEDFNSWSSALQFPWWPRLSNLDLFHLIFIFDHQIFFVGCHFYNYIINIK